MIKKIKNNFPKMDFLDFFEGKVEAKGNFIQYYPKKKIKNLYINFEGKQSNNKLFIKEYYREDNLSIKRDWSFEKINENLLIGQEENVFGKIKVHTKDNFLTMNYLFKIKLGKLNFKVRVIDEMYKVSEKEIINFTVVNKYKINLAHSVLVYKKL